MFFYLLLVPKMYPIIRLDIPIPAKDAAPVRPMAVPVVACGTTRGMDDHVHTWRNAEMFQSDNKGFHSVP